MEEFGELCAIVDGDKQMPMSCVDNFRMEL